VWLDYPFIGHRGREIKALTLCPITDIIESLTSTEDTMITFNEQAGMWAWSNGREQGQTAHHYEARLMELSRKIAAAVQHTFKIPYEIKEDATQETMGIMLMQFSAQPEMASNTDSWIIYRAVAYAASYANHLRCTTARDYSLASTGDTESPELDVEGSFSWEQTEAELITSAFVATLDGTLKAVAIGLAADKKKQDIAAALGIKPLQVSRAVAKLKDAWLQFSLEQ